MPKKRFVVWTRDFRNILIVLADSAIIALIASGLQNAEVREKRNR